MALNFLNPRYNRYPRRLYNSYPEEMFDSAWGPMPRSTSAMNINEPDWQIVDLNNKIADLRRSYNDRPYNDRPYTDKPFNERQLLIDGRAFNERSYTRSPDMYQKKAFVDKNGFQVSLDVQHYQPNEISVRTEKNTVVVVAKHEEKQDEFGYVARELTRRYELPEGFKPEDVTSTLFDSILTIKAPARKPTNDATTRQVPIQQQQGPIRLNVNNVNNVNNE